MAKKAKPSDRKRITSLLRTAGGSRPLARLIAKGGAPLADVLLAIFDDARLRVETEGAPHIEAIVLTNRRRSWLTFRQDENRYTPMVTGVSGRLGTIDNSTIKKWFRDARTELRPISTEYRRTTATARNVAHVHLLMKKKHAAAVDRLGRAGLSVGDLSRKLETLAAMVVAAEHPEAGAHTSILAKGKRR